MSIAPSPHVHRLVRSLCSLAFAAVFSLVEPRAAVADDEVLYQGAPAAVTANVERWGKDCGVRPKSYTLNERPRVPVVHQDDRLTLRFPSGSVHSNQCWSKNPALQLVSTSARPGAWKTRCETPAGEPKSETGVYEIVARDASTLELTESSRYDWQLKSSHCVATVRTVRTLTRVSPIPEGDTAIPVAAQPAAEPPERAPPADDCVPGTLTSLRIQPSQARVEPGSRLCFVARGKDADGCTIKDPPVEWTLRSLDHGHGQMRGNCFRSAPSAAEGEGRYRVTATSGKLSARALLRVVTPDLSDITLQGLPSNAGGAPSADEMASAGTQVRSESHVAAQPLEDHPRRGMWLGLLASLAAILGAGAAWMTVRRRSPQTTAGSGEHAVARGREASPPPAAARPSPTPRRAAASPSQPKPAPKRQPTPAAKPSEPMICPKCRRGYAPGSTRCESDDAVLMTYKAFTAQAASQKVTCKACGASLEDGSTFCGRCGARLSS